MIGYDNLDFEWLIEQLYNGSIYTNLPDYQRKSWVRYCYHFSDVQNIASILNLEIIYSRNRSYQLGIMGNDNASSEVIDQTDSWVKDYIRFYFRPKTPTQYNNEGFRSSCTMSLYHAHCPVPVFLLFDLNGVLNLENSYFTNSSLANNTEHHLMSTPHEFQELPFSKIYHDSYVTPDIRDEIVACRHAEIVVPNELKIDGLLKRILVRSTAEKKTLLSLLSDEALYKYGDLIQIDSKKTVFFARWDYFENVILTESRIRIIDNNTGHKSQYNLNVVLNDNQNRIKQTYNNKSWIASGDFILGIGTPTNSYEIEIYLDGNLAYKDKFEAMREFNQPF